MELEVGMYVRSEYCNSFGKIKKIYTRDLYADGTVRSYNIETDVFSEKAFEPIFEGEYQNVSHNIIDLIEVGDYVNGSKVCDVIINKDFNIYKVELETRRDGALFPNTINPKQIKSIVTKEQFKNMEYEVK